MKKFKIALAIIAMCGLTINTVQASRLSDLVKQRPSLYLPARLVGEQPATFTVKAKPGQFVHLILSADNIGAKLPDGTPMSLGKTVFETNGTIPASGVLNLTVTLPQAAADDAEQEFVEALVSDTADGANPQMAQIYASSGILSRANSVAVVDKPSKGSVMVVPGDASISRLLNSMDTLSQAKNDPHKASLIDNGQINRDRVLDRNLLQQPSAMPLTPGFGY